MPRYDCNPPRIEGDCENSMGGEVNDMMNHIRRIVRCRLVGMIKKQGRTMAVEGVAGLRARSIGGIRSSYLDPSGRHIL